MSRIAVIALGGGTILGPAQQGSAEDQRKNLKATCDRLVGLVVDGWRLLLTHGNGPQVGNIILQNEHARTLVPPMPVDVCGAESQGQVGYLLQTALENALRACGLQQRVACVVTRVLVDDSDPSFITPEKAVGPLYTAAKAMDLMRRGMAMKEGERGWRQVVPSPRPLQVLETPIIRDLLDKEYIVIAAGGGGVPVGRSDDGALHGVGAVVEKDLTTSLLAAELHADLLVYLTDVPHVVLHTGDEPVEIKRLTLAQARHLAGTALPRHSMGVKVEAAAQFVDERGKTVIITDSDHLAEAVNGHGGTCIVAGT